MSLIGTLTRMLRPGERIDVPAVPGSGAPTITIDPDEHTPEFYAARIATSVDPDDGPTAPIVAAELLVRPYAPPTNLAERPTGITVLTCVLVIGGVAHRRQFSDLGPDCATTGAGEVMFAGAHDGQWCGKCRWGGAQ